MEIEWRDQWSAESRAAENGLRLNGQLAQDPGQRGREAKLGPSHVRSGVRGAGHVLGGAQLGRRHQQKLLSRSNYVLRFEVFRVHSHVIDFCVLWPAITHNARSLS